MKGMRLLPVILMLLLISSVCAISLQDCFASHTDNGNEKDETENVYSYVTYTDNDDDESDTVNLIIILLIKEVRLNSGMCYFL